MTRLNLNPLGRHGDAKNTFIVAVIVTVAIRVFQGILESVYGSMKDELHGDIPPGIYVPYVIFTFPVWFYFMWILVKTRWHIRNKYHIPSRLCGPVEDIFCGLCCPCCSVSQMGRHTTNYGTNKAQCCTKTGLNLNVPFLDDIEQPPRENTFFL